MEAEEFLKRYMGSQQIMAWGDVIEVMREFAKAKCKEQEEIAKKQLPNVGKTNANNVKQTEFRALMYCGNYIDANALDKGLYTCSKPYIYDKYTTIEFLKNQISLMVDMLGKSFVSTRLLENLEKCQLVPVFITEPIQ